MVNTTTTTITRHTADLAGGIKATAQRAVHGATLSLDDGLRRLTLTLTPEQVAEMVRVRPSNSTLYAFRIWTNLEWFVSEARGAIDTYEWQECTLWDADYRDLRALAAAVQAEIAACDNAAREDQP